jgi:hypothetical protein
VGSGYEVLVCPTQSPQKNAESLAENSCSSTRPQPGNREIRHPGEIQCTQRGVEGGTGADKAGGMVDSAHGEQTWLIVGYGKRASRAQMELAGRGAGGKLLLASEELRNMTVHQKEVGCSSCSQL